MKRAVTAILAAWLLGAVPAHAQRITVAYQKSLDLPVAGATAAYSLDPLIAEATAANGIVRLSGLGPGEARVIVVTPVGTQTLDIFVPQPPPSYPPGFVPPTPLDAVGENGMYEFRYGSDRSQGDRRTELRMVNANMLSADSDSRISFPSLSYLVDTPNREIVVLDQQVDSSPLTVDGIVVRGFHYRQGGWQFHGGYASQTNFQDLLLSTDKEQVFSLSRSLPLGEHGALISSLFYFPTAHATSVPGQSGAVGSLMFKYKLNDDFDYALEAGFSRGLGGSGSVHYSSLSNQLRAQFRYQPEYFAGLGLNALPGHTATLDYTHMFSQKLSVNASGNSFGYVLPTTRQQTMTSTLLLRYQLTRHFGVHGGAGISDFSSTLPTTSRFRSLNVPVGLDYSSRHFGAGVQYQHTGNSGGVGDGRQISGNVHVGAGQLQASAFVDHQTQAPSLLTTVASDSPLKDSVSQQAALASTVQGVASGLQNNALLLGLGYVNSVGVGVVSRRLQWGGSVNWASASGRDRFNYSLLSSNDEYSTGNIGFASHTVTYSRRLNGSNDVGFSLSMFSLGGLGGGGYHLRYQLEFTHNFNTFPAFLAPGSHGNINGHAFLDPQGSGDYVDSALPVPDVEVVLDGQRHTRTNQKGYYIFDHVPAGTHHVEAAPAKDEQRYYTTASMVETDINHTVNFGIGQAAGQVYGFVLNDGGEGVEGVRVMLESNGQRQSAKTADDGKFSQAHLPEGQYTVTLDPDSIPPGYALDHLETMSLELHRGSPAELVFHLKASRVIAGRVIAFDGIKGEEVPVAGVMVSLRELPAAVMTDAKGVYRFKDMPAGNYTVVVVYGGKEYSSSVVLSSNPANRRDANISVGAAK